MTHFLLTLPLLALGVLFIKNKNFLFKSFSLVCLAVLVNLPIFNHLSLCDWIFSFSGALSFFWLVFCTLVILQSLQGKPALFLDARGFLFYGTASLIFFLSFLDILPFNLYFLEPRWGVAIACGMILISYFFNQILAFLFLLSLLTYGLSLFDFLSVFDYFFDIFGCIASWILGIYCFLQSRGCAKRAT